MLYLLGVFGFLRKRGCPVFQGFYFGEPCGAQDFADRFRSGLLPLSAAPHVLR